MPKYKSTSLPRLELRPNEARALDYRRHGIEIPREWEVASRAVPAKDARSLNAKSDRTQQTFSLDRESQQEYANQQLLRERAAERTRQMFPDAFAAQDYREGKKVALAPELQSFMEKREPAVDWSKVRVRRGWNIPTSVASTIGDTISFDASLEYGPGSPEFVADLFHELSHVPQWNDGRLTFGRYVKQAAEAGARYLSERFQPTESAVHAMEPGFVPSPPRNPQSVWMRIPLEGEAIENSKRLQDQYRRLYPDAAARRVLSEAPDVRSDPALVKGTRRGG